MHRYYALQFLSAFYTRLTPGGKTLEGTDAGKLKSS